MHRVQTMFASLLASENRRARMLVTVSVFDASERRLHQTFRLKAWTNRQGERIVTADLNDGVYGVYETTRVLHMNAASGETFAAKGAPSDRLLAYAAKAALTFARTGTVPQPGNGRVECVEASLCGRCGLELTDPVSIERGIGPECFGKETGTTTIRSRPKATRAEKAMQAQRSEAKPSAPEQCSQLTELPGSTWEDIFKAGAAA